VDRRGVLDRCRVCNRRLRKNFVDLVREVNLKMRPRGAEYLRIIAMGTGNWRLMWHGMFLFLFLLGLLTGLLEQRTNMRKGSRARTWRV
jgi:hypothetical protein